MRPTITDISHLRLPSAGIALVAVVVAVAVLLVVTYCCC